MSIRKFNPKHVEHLENPERAENMDFDKLFSDIGITEGQTIADIGAGTGFYAIPLARKVGVVGKVYAVDISSEMLEHLSDKLEKEGLSNVETVLSKEKEIDIANGSADVVFMANVLHELKGIGTLNECLRILKDSGRFMVIDWDKISGGHGPPKFIRLKKEKAIIKCEKIGFRFVREFNTGNDKYGLIFSRSN